MDRQDYMLDEKGFTLVEVCLAVLVIGIGLLAIFSLFPSGLRSVEDDAADTRCGLFAQTVLSGMRGNVAGVTNWGDWCDRTWVSGELRQGVLDGGASLTTGTVSELVFPNGGTDYLRYRLTLNTANSNQYWALLEVENGRYPSGTLILPSKFYTEFCYQGK